MSSITVMNVLLLLMVNLIISSRGETKLRIPSFFIQSSELSASSCQNGATSINFPYLHNLRHLMCICPRGYSGRKCEIEDRATCYHGNGQDYRGTVAVSESGHTCIDWQFVRGREAFGIHEFTLGIDALALGLWGHNHCRNPDRRARPWCHVRRGLHIAQEFCNIPRCGGTPGSPASVPPAALQGPTTSTGVQDTAQMSSCGQNSQNLMKVVGGTVTTTESQPWVAAIFWRRLSGQYGFLCGGTLISPCWVLTAAHCFPDNPKSSAHRLSVVLGKDALNETRLGQEQRFGVEEIVVHPGFDNSNGSYDNDIALLKISTKTRACAKESSWVKTVCLPPDHQTLHPGASCIIAGYGKEHEGMWHNSQYLKEAKVNILSQDICRSLGYYGNMVTENMICAASPDWTADSCKGDSGGPLVCEVDGRYHVFGVISWGDGCSKEFRPGVYTRVSTYNKWISKQTGPLSPVE